MEDGVFGEILLEELQHLHVTIRRREVESAFHQGDVEGSTSATGVEDGGGVGDVVMREDGFEVSEDRIGRGEVRFHASVPQLVVRWNEREVECGNGGHNNSPERGAEVFGCSALSARRDEDPASRHVVLRFDPCVRPEILSARGEHARCLQFQLQIFFCTLRSSDDGNLTGAWDKCCESVIVEFFESREQRNPFLGAFTLDGDLLFEITIVPGTEA